MNNLDLIPQVRLALKDATGDDRYAFEKLALELTRFRSLFEIVKKIENGNGGIFNTPALDATRPLFRERTPEEELELFQSLREKAAAK